MKPGFLEKDPEKQKEMYQKFMLEVTVPHVAIVNSQLEKNGTGFLVGSEVNSSRPGECASCLNACFSIHR